MGRTWRHRSKRAKRSSDTESSGDDKMKLLLKAMGGEGFSSKNLRVSEFPSTGRGMMALKNFDEGDILISLPRDLLIGVRQVMMFSKWASELLKFYSSLSSMQLMCVFLLEGKYRVLIGDKFRWSFYINSLPRKFNHHIFWPDNILDLLPKCILDKATQIRDKVWEDFLGIEKSIPHCHEMRRYINWDQYRWAWCCINSRCIYSNHENPPNWKFLTPTTSDHYYLAPFLDMFNHSLQAQVVGSYNHTTQSYEIKSLQKWKKYQQIFICYGPHSTEDLFLEYGFVCPGENVNDVVDIPRSLLYDSRRRKLCTTCTFAFNTFLHGHRLEEGWNIANCEVSFNAKSSITLYTVLLTSCTGRHGQCPSSLSKNNMISTLLSIQCDRVSEQVKTQVGIAERTILRIIHDSIENDLLRMKNFIKLQGLSDFPPEFGIIQHLFRILLRNLSADKIDNAFL